MKIQIQYKKTDTIKANDYNPNEVPENIMKNLELEIKKNGFLDPIVINKDGTIIDGEHRFLTAKKIGLEEIPVIQLDVDETTAKKLTINLNQLKGSLNPLKFAEFLENLSNNLTMEEMEAALYMDQSEIEANIQLNNLPEIGEELTIEGEGNSQPTIVTCPHCGKEFDLRSLE